MSTQRTHDVSHLPDCPVETTLLLISNKWKVIIIRELLNGQQRFSQLKNAIGTISQKVLTANLRSMEEDGLVVRTAFPEVPPRVEYELTDLGHSLRPVLDALSKWGTQYQKTQKSTENLH